MYLFFYNTKDKYGFCSNFFILKKPMIIDNEKWINSEPYYQALKFRGKSACARSIEYSNLIREAYSPGKAKILGHQKKNLRFGTTWVLNKKTDQTLVNDIVDEYKDLKVRPDWENVKIKVMLKAVVYKFKDLELKKKLISICDSKSLLVEHTTRDFIWGDGANGNKLGRGTNYLGKILTALAYVLKDGSCKNMGKDLKRIIKIKI
jgi:predicted NAD-dependent protein-ADP-ribosyltransferase YbiA (DUF1768 family)